MDELLKACQKIQHAIVFLALAILILALAPDVVSNYKRAAKDLDAFIDQEEHYREFRTFVYKKHPKLNEIYSIISETARQSEILIPQEGFEVRSFPYREKMDFPDGDWMPQANEGKGGRVLTINALKRFLSSPRQDYETVNPNIAELRAASKQIFDRMAADRPLTLREVTLREKNDITPSTSLGTIDVVLELYLQQEISPQNKQRRNVFVKETITGQRIRCQASTFLDWLKTKRDFKYLSERINKDNLFAGLDAIWLQIGREDLREAGRILERQIAAMNETVSFLGISIPRTIGVIVGPALCLCAILYLIGHILHILNILERGSDESTRVFSFSSWVAVFPERVNSTITLAVLWGLPTAANCSLVIRLWGSSSSIEKMLSLAITILTFSAGLYIWILLRKVKKLVNIPNLEPAIRKVG